MSLHRKLFLYACMCLFSGTIMFILGEITIRLFLPQTDAITWQKPHPRYAYANRENTHVFFPFAKTDFKMEVKTNSLGLREREINEEFFEPNAKRILAIGDSMTFGFGVNAEERFSDLLEGLLRSNGYPYYVINTGVCGWGTIQETTHAKDHFDYLKPDIILLTFVGNDPTDDEKFEHVFKEITEGIVYFPGKDFLRINSHFYRLLTYYVRPVASNLIQLYILKEQKSETFDHQSATFISDEKLEKSMDRIKQFQSDFLAYNPDGVLLIQPSSIQNTKMRNYLASMANNRNIFYIDLQDDVKKIPKVSLDYDGHWSRAMHKQSALRTFETISSLDPVL